MKTGAKIFTLISWNIENFKKNLFSLKSFTDLYKPDLVFISEPQIFQSDLQHCMTYFCGDYSSSLNSEDFHSPDLALYKTKAKGGTLVMWRNFLSPFITILPVDTPAFLPVLLAIPHLLPSIHIALYLPTAGKEAQYVHELSELKVCVEALQQRFPNSPVFVRGDANSSKTNNSRNLLFTAFCHEYNLIRVPIGHNTYHHFMGQGKSDSELDVLLYSRISGVEEHLLAIHCKHDHPLVDSHHDLLVSTCSLPAYQQPEIDMSKNITAPKIDNNRQKVTWLENGILKYKELIEPLLPDIQSRWNDPLTPSSFSVLIQTTNYLMNEVAATTNKVTALTSTSKSQSEGVPHIVRKYQNMLAKANSKVKQTDRGTTGYQDACLQLKTIRKVYRRLIRLTRMHRSILRDSQLSNYCSDSSQFHSSARRNKNNNVVSINELKVNDKVYKDKNVCDGFYDSISTLKTLDPSSLSQSPYFTSAQEQYRNILKVCNSGSSVPQISLQKTRDILFALRPGVTDLYSITAYHYIYGGDSAISHLHSLLKSIIAELNNLVVEEVNTVWACILFKGHGKDTSLDRSYRTISTCPLISKVLDTYIAELYSPVWNAETAATQFQKQSSSHDLAALLLTETISYSMSSLSKPVFVLYLDAKSAFDLVLQEILIQKLFHSGIKDKGLILINSRLSNRKTVCEWNKQLMGPINDQCGVEQGGVNSTDFYNVYNNDQLLQAQESKLGVPIGPVTISSIGQADDVALVSNDIYALQGLFDLSLSYCKKHHITLCAEKTKLQVFSSKASDLEASFSMLISPVNMYGDRISFVNQTQHVGTLRSTDGNLPHILDRFSAYRKSMFALLPLGMARSHRANPAASLRAHQTYCLPVLLSGLPTLILSCSEIKLIDHKLKITSQQLQKLQDKTPAAVVYFLGGHLPGAALLHHRQLTVFGMVTRLKDSLLHQIAVWILTTSKFSTSSWFFKIRELILMYGLPSPFSLLFHPPTKSVFKRMIKSKILDFWETKLRKETTKLPSLRYFRPDYMSLTSPHPLWKTCGSNPYEIHKAVIQARMLSGRYQTEDLSKHWTDNTAGLCLLPTCSGLEPGSIEHLLVSCQALQSVRTKMITLAYKAASRSDYIYPIVTWVLSHPDRVVLVQFLLDCSTIPLVISSCQTNGPDIMSELFYITRNWCYTLHRKRMELLNLPQYR